MKYFLYGIAGIFGGLIGGMGMGGGTILIPILNIFYDINQHTSQAINLISFIPMAIVALILHIKNKLIKFDFVLCIIISGALSCVGGCYLAKIITGKLLKRLFGGFLLVLSVFQFFDFIKMIKKKN